MAKFTKEILRAGTFKKNGELIRVSDGDLQLALENYKKMQAAGYRVPVIIEHSDSQDPEGLPVKASQTSTRDKAKYQAGWSEDLKIENGSLVATLDVKSRAGNTLIKEVGTYTSPQFGPWKVPETGEIQPMTITHFALTPYPVDIGQDPTFTEIPDVQPIAATQLSHLVSFSMADMVPSSSSKKPPFGQGQDEDQDDDSDIDNDDDGIPDADDNAPDNPNDALSQIPNGGDDAIIAQCAQVLAEMGVITPDSVNIKTNPKALLAALMTAQHHLQKAEVNDVPDPVPNGDPNNPSQQPPQSGQDPRLRNTRQESYITMSQAQDAVKKGKPTVTTQLHEHAVDIKTLPEFVQMSQTNSALSSELTSMKREKYAERIARLVKSGRATKQMADGLTALVGTYQFSTAGESKDTAKLDAQLELAEQLPAGAVWADEERIQQMGIQEQEQPGFFKEESPAMTPEEEDAMLDRTFGKLSR